MTHTRAAMLSGDRKRLWVKAIQLGEVRRRLKYVDYEQAQLDCEALAARLLAAYARADLREFAFVGIPRGGLIVLGLLAYVLDLEPGQLAPAAAPRAPLCIVDDCSLTGARLSQALARLPNEHVVFAHLYSHPDLRRGILEQEPRVRCCVAARDLEGFTWGTAPDAGAGAGAPPSGLGFRGYWSGSAAPIAFAWSEPAMHVLDPFTHEVEGAWRFAPPHLCLKNKVELGVPPDPAAVRTWRTAVAVVTGQADGVMWVIQTERAQAYAFEGIDADMWRGLAATGSLDAACAYVESRHGTGDGALRARLAGFAGMLAAEGLIEPA